MTQLSQSVSILVVDVCSGERLVVGVHMESATFDEILESLDRFVDSKKFSVENTVLRFGIVMSMSHNHTIRQGSPVT